MQKQKLIILSLLMFAVFSLFLKETHAQDTSSLESIKALTEVNENDIFIELNPQIPQPNSNLTITLSSFLMNLDTSLITWTIDGKVKSSSFGEKKLKITTGDIGQKQTIQITIKNSSIGLFFEKEVIIEPASSDLLWETVDGHTPPFYKGKVLPVRESTIKITAIPNTKGKTITEQKNLVYTWKRNFDVVQDSSGFGKQSFSFKNALLKEDEAVSVSIINQTGSYQSESLNRFKYYNPLILFYEKKDGVGVDYWNALSDNVGVGMDDFKIIAEPFFMTPKDKNDPTLKYSWKINDSVIETPSYKSYLIIRGDGGVGKSAIELNIDNINRMFQSSKKILKVNINEN